MRTNKKLMMLNGVALLRLLKSSKFIYLPCILLLTGCLSTSIPPIRFYTLAQSPSADAIASVANEKSGPYLEFATIQVPERLRRPQFVINHKGKQEVQILEQDRWAAPFDDELSSALKANIARRTNAIESLPTVREKQLQAYRIAIVLRQLTAVPAETISAEFIWTISPLPSAEQDKSADQANALSTNCKLLINKELAQGTEALVSGYQAMVDTLAENVANNIISLNAGKKPECK